MLDDRRFKIAWHGGRTPAEAASIDIETRNKALAEIGKAEPRPLAMPDTEPQQGVGTSDSTASAEQEPVIETLPTAAPTPAESTADLFQKVSASQCR